MWYNSVQKRLQYKTFSDTARSGGHFLVKKRDSERDNILERLGPLLVGGQPRLPLPAPMYLPLSLAQIFPAFHFICKLQLPRFLPLQLFLRFLRRW